MTELSKAIKIRINVLAAEDDMSINELAKWCGINQSTIQNITSGRNASATVSTIKKICDGLNISLAQFFNDKVFNELK